MTLANCVDGFQTVDVNVQSFKQSAKIFLLMKAQATCSVVPRKINRRAVLEIFFERVAFEEPQTAQVVAEAVSPHGKKYSEINDGFGAVMNFFGRCVSRAHAAKDETVLDELAATVDEAAQTRRAVAVDVKMFVRKDNGAFKNFEAQLFVDEIILAENFSGVVRVVKVIKIVHAEASESAANLSVDLVKLFQPQETFGNAAVINAICQKTFVKSVCTNHGDNHGHYKFAVERRNVNFI